MYSSQKSCQKNLSIGVIVCAKLYSSNALSTVLFKLFSFDNIHRSNGPRLSLTSSYETSSSNICMLMNLNAFQNFLRNLNPCLMSFQSNITSDPGTLFAAHVLNGSAPYFSITSSGPTTNSGLDLLILFPSSPNTIPLITMSSNGFWPVNAIHLSVV